MKLSIRLGPIDRYGDLRCMEAARTLVNGRHDVPGGGAVASLIPGNTVRHAVALNGPGRIEIVRLIKEVDPPEGFLRAPGELVYLAKPAMRESLVHWVHFAGQEETEAFHQPLFLEGGSRLRMFHAPNELEQVVRQLRASRERYCYIWRSADASMARAWLFMPR